jgi:putative isomerase
VKTVPPQRAWNTWDAEHPACAVHLPSGFSVRLSAYSASEGRYTDFPFDVEAVRLGPHGLDGSFADVELVHAGSRLRLRFASAADGAIVGEIEVLETAEWGLRFWYSLAVGFAPGFGEGEVRLAPPVGEAVYVDPPVVTGGAPDGAAAAFVVSLRPVNAFVYDDLSEAKREFEDGGYYARPETVRERGSWVVFRFNAVEPRVRFAAAVAPGEDDAVGAARAALAGASFPPTPAGASEAGVEQPAGVDSIRDVLAWNTVWDPINRRLYTAATRGWVAEKFGGWIVWQLDAFLHAIMAAELGDREVAEANLDTALSLATEAGNLAALGSGVTSWVDRSHPPIGAFATWWVRRRLDDPAVLERAFPALARAHAWWFANRDGNGNGLLEYGSSPVGDGHFVHTKLAAMDESAMDNSPVHDEAEFRNDTHTLDVEDVGLNSLLVLDAEMLARMADELGRTEEASALRERGARLAELVRANLWDAERGVFANRKWSGAFVRSVSPTSFYPLLAGVATDEQAQASVRGWLLDPGRFWTDWPVACTPLDDRASLDNVYWRGRVWPPLNFFVYLALRRLGQDRAASELARRGEVMFRRGWHDRRSFENFNQRSGAGGDSPDADAFYTWGALLPLLALIDERGGNPWDDVIGR